MKKVLKSNKKYYFCNPVTHGNAFVAQLDRASHYGWEGLGFESLQVHDEGARFNNLAPFFVSKLWASLNWTFDGSSGILGGNQIISFFCSRKNNNLLEFWVKQVILL